MTLKAIQRSLGLLPWFQNVGRGGHHLNLNRPDSGLLEPCGWGHLELWGGNLPSRATGMVSPIQWVLKAGPLLQGTKGRVSDQREFFSSLKM